MYDTILLSSLWVIYMIYMLVMWDLIINPLDIIMFNADLLEPYVDYQHCNISIRRPWLVMQFM